MTLESQESSHLPPEETVNRLAKKFPEGFSIIFLTSEEYSQFMSNDIVDIEDHYGYIARPINPQESTGQNSREALIQLFSGNYNTPSAKDLFIHPAHETKFIFGSHSVWLSHVVKKTNDGAVKHANEHPEKLDEKPVILLSKVKKISPKTHEKVNIQVHSSEIVSKLELGRTDLLRMAELINQKQKELFDNHVTYMRKEFPNLSDASEDEIIEASPYLDSEMDGSDALMVGVEDFTTEKIRNWLISLVV